MTNNKDEGKCVLYDRDCIDCGECDICDLDKNKICDNCGKCLNFTDVASIKIDGVYTDEKSGGANSKNLH
ncbi:MAG: hypothetical protein IJW13_03815 [Clostridia bacterium]|nr:hypothetical protein [Clostridia bacterium]